MSTNTSSPLFWADLIHRLYAMMMDFDNDQYFKGALYEVISNSQSHQLMLLERELKALQEKAVGL